MSVTHTGELCPDLFACVPFSPTVSFTVSFITSTSTCVCLALISSYKSIATEHSTTSLLASIESMETPRLTVVPPSNIVPDKDPTMLRVRRNGRSRFLSNLLNALSAFCSFDLFVPLLSVLTMVKSLWLVLVEGRVDGEWYVGVTCRLIIAPLERHLMLGENSPFS